MGVLVQPDQLALLRLPDPLDQASLHDVTEQQFVCLFYGESISFLPTKNPLRRGKFQPQHSGLIQPKPLFVLVV